MIYKRRPNKEFPNGEEVSIEKIDNPIHERDVFSVKDSQGEFYISEARLKAEFTEVKTPKIKEEKAPKDE